MNETPRPPSDDAASESLTGQVTAGPGGAMTDEVGVITGDLTLTTSLEDDGLAHPPYPVHRRGRVVRPDRQPSETTNQRSACSARTDPESRPLRRRSRSSPHIRRHTRPSDGEATP